MKLFFEYLWLHKKSILLYLLFTAVFALVMSLSGAPLAALLYSAAICLAIAIFVAALSFMRFRRRHLILSNMRSTVGVSLAELPAPRNIIERDYDALLRELESDKRRAESERDIALAEARDYYTLWAHQIKTPIAAMYLLLQTGGEHDPELDEQLFRIEQYVEMVLQYNRTEGGASDYVIRQYDLGSIVKNAVRKYARSFIRKKVTLELGNLDRTVTTDEKWLCFAIEQLLSNALKYTREGGRVRIYATEPLSLCIEDDGIGIAAEDLPRVFDKGYTGYNGRAERKSTGIGLYLCRQAMLKLGHGVSLRSEVGRGTTAVISLFTVRRGD